MQPKFDHDAKYNYVVVVISKLHTDILKNFYTVFWIFF